MYLLFSVCTRSSHPAVFCCHLLEQRPTLVPNPAPSIAQTRLTHRMVFSVICKHLRKTWLRDGWRGIWDKGRARDCSQTLGFRVNLGGKYPPVNSLRHRYNAITLCMGSVERQCCRNCLSQLKTVAAFSRLFRRLGVGVRVWVRVRKWGWV